MFRITNLKIKLIPNLKIFDKKIAFFVAIYDLIDLLAKFK
jgi:hypothetical protein